MDIRSAERLIQTFLTVNNWFTAGQIAVFLRVATRGASTISEMAEYTGMSRPSVTRICNMMVATKRGGQGGLGLFQVGVDPENTKANLYTLSAKGRRLKAQLEDI